jgi:hypothetical protein
MRSFRGREPLSGVRLCKRTRSSDASAATDIAVARGATVGRRDATRAPVTAVEALRDIYVENTRTNARSSVIAHESERSHPSRNTVSTPSLVPTALARTSGVPRARPPPRNPRSPPLPRPRSIASTGARARPPRATASARDVEKYFLRARRRDRAHAPRSQRATSSSNPSDRQ